MRLSVSASRKGHSLRLRPQKKLRDLAQGFQRDGPGIGAQSIDVPGLAVVAIGGQARLEAGVTRPADAHVNQHFGEVGDADAVLEEKAEHDFVVGGGAESEVESAEALIDRAANKKGRVRRHPAPIETLGTIGAGLPVTGDLDRLTSTNTPFDIAEIAITTIDRRIIEESLHSGQGLGGGVEVIGIEDTDDLPLRQGDPLVHGIVDPLVRLTDQLRQVQSLGSGDLQGRVRRSSVDENMLDRHGLVADAVQIGGESGGGVVGRGDDGDIHSTSVRRET